MSVSIAPYPRFKAFYPATGSPLSGGQLYTVQPGTTVQFGIPPAYPLATYTDSTGLTQNNNPVTLDSNGEADVWLSGYTKFVLFDANGNLVWTKDNVSSSPALQSISLQWVPQSTQVTFYSPTQFIVPGNQTAIFLPGTAVLATMTGATAIGIVQSASTGGTPVVTTVTVAWFSTQAQQLRVGRCHGDRSGRSAGLHAGDAHGTRKCQHDRERYQSLPGVRRKLRQCGVIHPAGGEQRAERGLL